MMQRALVFLACLLCLSAGAQKQRIQIIVHGLENSDMILAYYYGDKQFVKDTFRFNRHGEIMLQADTSLPGGVYLCVLPKLGNKYFEFVVNEPEFTLETDAQDLSGHMKVRGSLENLLFYEDMRFLQATRSASDSLTALYKSAKSDGKKMIYKGQLQDIDNEVKVKRSNTISLYPGSFYGKMLNAMKDPFIPDPPKDGYGNVIDTLFRWRYYKQHYWDNIDLSDVRLLRCPVFHNKLKTYITQTVVQSTDSINAAGDELLHKTDLKGEVYKYIITYIFNEFANRKGKDFQSCYVFFGENYYCSGLTPWVEEGKLSEICNRVRQLDPYMTLKSRPAIHTTIIPAEPVGYEQSSAGSKGLSMERTIDPGIKSPGKYYALLIAAQSYQDKEIQSLENPVADSKNLAAVLGKNYNFDSIRLLKNPSKSEIMRAIYAYRTTLKENDNFLLFYSGHGYWDQESEQGYWFPVNADRSDPSTWVSNSDIKDEIKAMKCLHALLVSDACFSGGIFRTRDVQLNNASRTVQELYKTKSRKAMTSGALTEVPDKSAFIKYMIDALNTNSDSYISAEKLFNSFKENAINNSKISGLIPQFGVITDTDDKGGDFIFIRK